MTESSQQPEHTGQPRDRASGPAHFSASVRIGQQNPGFELSGDAARALAAVMALCTVIVGAEGLVAAARLARKALRRA